MCTKTFILSLFIAVTYNRNGNFLLVLRRRIKKLGERGEITCGGRP